MGIAQNLRLLVERSRIIQGSVTANWNGGIATSTKAGGDLFTYGQVDQWWRMCEAYLLLAAFSPAATVTIRAYENLMGAEREIMNDNWVVALDGDVAFIIWFWDVQILGPVRIEVYSDTPADDGLAVPYEVRVKGW